MEAYEKCNNIEIDVNKDHSVADELSVNHSVMGTLGMRYCEIHQQATLGVPNQLRNYNRVLLNNSEIKRLNIYKSIINKLCLTGTVIETLHVFKSEIFDIFSDDKTSIGKIIVDGEEVDLETFLSHQKQ